MATGASGLTEASVAPVFASIFPDLEQSVVAYKEEDEKDDEKSAMKKDFIVEPSGSVVTFPDPASGLFRPYRVSEGLGVPRYLEQTYWWAYLHPKGVRFFERQWLVNLILWGNFSRLRDAALAELGPPILGRMLQVACVYGDFTPKLADRLHPAARLDVVDVAPVQLDNLSRKLRRGSQVYLHHQDSTRLEFGDATFDNLVVFFLLHEQPATVRKNTIREALRVVKPGGKVVFVDYHRPLVWNPFRYLMIPILRTLEPFALDMWENEIANWIGKEQTPESVRKETYFGGLYQKTVLIR